VYRSTTNGGPYAKIASGIVSTNTTNTGLTNGTTYYYVVTAVNAGGESGYSSQASATPLPPPPPPTNLSATRGNGQVSLTWTASLGAASYNMYRSTTNGGPYAKIAGGIVSTNTTDTGVTNGTTYYYVVTAVNAGGESGYSSQASATPQVPPPLPPTNLSATGGNVQVSLTWTASLGATNYNLYRSTTNGGPYAKIASGIVSTNTTDTGVTNGTTYYYVVTAVNAGGESGYSSQASATPQVPLPLPPTNLSASAGNGQVSLTWTASSGAASYNLYRSTTNGGPYAEIASGIVSTNTTNTGLTNGTTYYYVVMAVNAAGESAYSSQASATPNLSPPLPPTNLSAIPGNAQVSLAWTASLGATNYNLYRSTTNGGPYAKVTSGIVTTTNTNTGLKNGTNYYYVVTALNAAGESGYSGQASATPLLHPPPPPPTNLSATAGNAQVSLTWTASLGATNYNLYRSTTNGGPYAKIASGIVSTNTTDTGVTNGTTYYYVVTAVNTNGESGYSSQASATPQAPPPPPTNLSATGGNAQVSLAWTASVGAASYNMYRSTTNGGPYAKIASGIVSTNTTDTGVTNGTTYYYVVTAVNAGGESGYSGQASATPQAPPPPPTNLSANAGNAQVSLTWTASPGAASYNMYRSTTNGGPYAKIASGIVSTNTTDTGVTNGTTYYYVVTAVNTGGESGYSGQASATPQAPLPQLSILSGTNGLTVSWANGNLQSTTNLSPASWQIVTTTNGQTSILVSPALPRQFFRVIQP
jgi:fibronectin type 3 domain-containing protein